jgi:hypothetical protein
MPINFNVKTKIKINGKEYNSPEEMPADVRSLYEKAIANRQSSETNIQLNTNSKITFNGQTFNTLDEMPADVRRIYDSIMAAVDKNGDGIPDSLQGDGGTAIEPSAPFLPTQNQVTAPSKANSLYIILAIIGLLFLLLIGTLILALVSRGL